MCASGGAIGNAGTRKNARCQQLLKGQVCPIFNFPMKSEVKMNRLMKLSEVVHALGVTNITVRSMIAAGKVAAVRVGTGRGQWRVSEDALRKITGGE